MRAFLAILLATVLIAPVASAESSASLLMKMDSPGKMAIEMKGTFTGEEASEMREQMDSYGDGDGTVSAEEVSSMETLMRGFMQQAEGEDSDAANEAIGGGFTIDGKGANEFRFVDVDIQGAEGPVTSDKGWSALLTMEILFPIEAGNSHTIRIAGSDGEDDDSASKEFIGEIESAKFRASSGYVFSDVQGMPAGAKLSDDKKEIDFADAVAASTGETVITMSKGGSGGGVAPGLGFAAIVVALAMLVVVARRR